jgi:hypothetical protein
VSALPENIWCSSIWFTSSAHGLAMFAGVWQAGGMKKQASDQSSHDRRYQERKRAEAERKAPQKKVVKQGGEAPVPGSESRVPSS